MNSQTLSNVQDNTLLSTWKNRKLSDHVLTLLTIILCLIWVVPIIWATVVSFRPTDDPLGRGDVWFGETITTESYETATDLAPFFPSWKGGNLWDAISSKLGLLALVIGIVGAAMVVHLRFDRLSRGMVNVIFGIGALILIVGMAGEFFDLQSYYRNTVEFVVLTLIVQLITVTLTGFAFAHFKFLGKRVFFYFVLLQMMIPTAILIVPNFVTVREFTTVDLLIPKFIYYHEFQLLDTPWAMAMPYFGSAFGTFLMRQAFLEVPSELVDAGRIDGCRWHQLLWNVYLPPARTSLVAFGLVSVSFHWNELLWPLVVTSDKARPLTMGLLRFTQLTEIGAQWSLIMAATMIIAAPLLVLFLIFQRQFLQSFLHSGLK